VKFARIGYPGGTASTSSWRPQSGQKNSRISFFSGSGQRGPGHRVSWTDPIVLPLSPYLSIVKNAAGVYAVKCFCGHDFADYRHNWKTSALMNVRDTEEKLQELVGRRSSYPVVVQGSQAVRHLREGPAVGNWPSMSSPSVLSSTSTTCPAMIRTPAGAVRGRNPLTKPGSGKPALRI